MPPQIQKSIHDILKQAIDKEMAEDNWQEYCLQPFEIQVLNKDFLKGKEELLERNLRYVLERLESGLIMPNWHWGQHEEEFEKARWKWSGYLTFIAVKSLMI